MAETRKFIVGWLTCKPGKRDAFLEYARAYTVITLQEPGCIFYEMNPSSAGPDMVILTECFVDDAAHTAHMSTPEFEEFFAHLKRLSVSGKFENIFAERVVTDTPVFDG